MLKVYTLPLGSYQTNCYIIHEENSKTCCVIDPGYTPDMVLDKVDALGLSVEAILLTHGHFDHVGGVKAIAQVTGCAVYLCAEELSLPRQFTAGELFFTDTYGEGDQLQLAGLTFRVLHTPGHTPGSVCLLAEDHLFAGDTLFRESCGRTDLPGGSWAEILKSLRRLKTLPGSTHVFSGHGPATTISDEKLFNPYMQ